MLVNPDLKLNTFMKTNVQTILLQGLTFKKRSAEEYHLVLREISGMIGL